MKTKIPPPIVLLIFVLLMWSVARFVNAWQFTMPAQFTISLILLSLGFLVTIAAVVGFRGAATTVNPLAPEKATSLVTSGVFRFSRNPMYLGMLLVLLAWFLYLGSLLNLTLVFFFVLFMVRFQIEPEEQAMQKLFGTAYTDYQSHVRRWL